MRKDIMTANRAVAEAVKLAKPQVVPVYPITPQTTISEYLAQLVADGDLDAEYIRVESEHSAMSATLGASQAGVRAFTATSSQGLLYMHEVVYAAAGMRAPIVMADANRAISSPLNIWNDQQDSIVERDAGWIQIYVESAQEAFDSIIMGYKIAENENVLLPLMVCLDGFILTHTVEPVEIPEESEVDEFLPPYAPDHAFLDPATPMSLGTLADPAYYTEARFDMNKALMDSASVIEEVGAEFGEKFGRKYGLIETYKCEDADIILVAMGSLCGTLRAMVDQFRENGDKVGMLRVRSYRPFPYEEINEVIGDAKLAVLDKNVLFGIGGSLYADIKAKCDTNEIYSFVLGLGGRDITPEYIEEVLEITKNPQDKEVYWIGLKGDA